MKSKNQIKILLTAIFIFISGIIFFLSNEFIEPAFNDFFVKSATYKKDFGAKDIVLVVIDDPSLEQIRFPWARDLYSQIFDFLENKAKAKIILFDAILSSPDIYNPEADKKFADYIKNSKKVILGFDMCKIGNTCVAMQKNMQQEFDEKFDINIINQRKSQPNTSSYTGIMYMPVEFLKSAKKLGSVIVMDRAVEKIRNEKSIRTYSHIVYNNGKYYPSLALAGYANANNDKDFVLSKNSLRSKKTNLLIKFPPKARKSQSSYTYLKWYKPYDPDGYYTHKAYSAIDIINLNNQIDSGGSDKIISTSGEMISPETFKDKYVLVGGNAAAQSLDDKLGSPVLINHAGVDIQATALNNYLDNTYMQKADLKLNFVISAVILTISFFLILTLPTILAITINFALIFLYFVTYVTCIDHNYILNFITILLLEIVLFAFMYTYKFVIEGAKKDKIQKAMGKYLSVDVMQKVVKDIDDLELGGKKVEATIMFIDIRRFTTISENMAADDVSELLNEYFTTIYPIITKYKGILNKFIGDAVLAIFVNEKEHAKNAIYCAEEILQMVKKLQQKWLSIGKPKIDVGVGINSGEVFIGNIGTQERMEYTVIGDTVNTASRIEGYNKTYKTKFLIGEYTYELVKNIVDVIKINQVTIRGKSQKTNIYEVLRIRK